MKLRLTTTTARIANLFGAVGYTLLSLVYIAAIGGVTVWLVQRDTLAGLGIHPVQLSPAPPPPIDIIDTRESPSLPQLLLTSVMLVVASFVVVSLPYWLGRSSSRVLKRAIRLLNYPVTLRSLLAGKMIACGLATIPALLLVMCDMRQLPLVVAELGTVTLAAAIFLVQSYLALRSETMEAKDLW